MPQRSSRIIKEKKKVVDDGKSQVTYSISITKNIGDFESLKIQAGITIPLGVSDEVLHSLEDLLVVAREKVVTRVASDIDEISNTL